MRLFASIIAIVLVFVVFSWFSSNQLGGIGENRPAFGCEPGSTYTVAECR